MQSIMYHYVRTFNPAVPNLKFLNVKNFEQQLDMFEEKFGFIKYDEWLKCLENKSIRSFDNKILLTFDDATFCHYKYVYKTLIKKKLWGIFYIPSSPYTSGEMLPVHKVHLICGKIKPKDLFNYTMEIVNDKIIKTEKKVDFAKNTYKHQNENSFIQEVKRILNYYIDENHKNEIINLIGKKFNLEFCANSYYLTVDEIKEMSENKMIMGSHTSSHPVMSKLSKSSQKIEIGSSFEFLQNIVSQDIKTYCHPFGGSHTFNIDTIKILESHNVDFSFSVEPRNITNSDLKNSIHFLPRYDCNLFQFGQVD